MISQKKKDLSLDDVDGALASILASIRATQRANRFLGPAYGTALTPAESHLLIEIALDGQRSLHALSALLGLDTSTISRTVASLVDQGLVQAEDAGRGRKRSLALTTRGKETLKQSDLSANKTTSKLSSALSADELKTLQQLSTAFATGVGAPPPPPRPGEHALRPAIRSITRELGLLGPRVFHSIQFTSLEWHVLSELTRYPDRTPSDLLEVLPVAATTLSTALRSLEQRQFIGRKTDSFDSRRRLFSMKARGATALQKLEQEAISQIRSALELFSSQEIETFAALFAKFAGGPPVKERALHTTPTGLLRRLTAEELSHARGWAITLLVDRNQQYDAPELLVAEQSVNVGFFVRGALQGVLEIQGHGQERVVSLLLLGSEEDTPRNRTALLLEGMKLVQDASPEVLLGFGSLAAVEEVLATLQLPANSPLRVRRTYIDALSRRLREADRR